MFATDEMYLKGVVELVKFFGWQRFAVIYNDLAFYQALVDALVHDIGLENIDIRYFPVSSISQQSTFDEVFQNISDSGPRVIISLLFDRITEIGIAAYAKNVYGKQYLYLIPFNDKEEIGRAVAQPNEDGIKVSIALQSAIVVHSIPNPNGYASLQMRNILNSTVDIAKKCLYCASLFDSVFVLADAIGRIKESFGYCNATAPQHTCRYINKTSIYNITTGFCSEGASGLINFNFAPKTRQRVTASIGFSILQNTAFVRVSNISFLLSFVQFFSINFYFD